MERICRASSRCGGVRVGLGPESAHGAARARQEVDGMRRGGARGHSGAGVRDAASDRKGWRQRDANKLGTVTLTRKPVAYSWGVPKVCGHGGCGVIGGSDSLEWARHGQRLAGELVGGEGEQGAGGVLPGEEEGHALVHDLSLPTAAQDKLRQLAFVVEVRSAQ